MGGRIDLHCHSLFSDGALLPIELIRRVQVMGFRAVAITDHVSRSNVNEVVPKLIHDCDLAKDYGIVALAGVEVTHVPPNAIPEVVRAARNAGARVVVVHGETVTEPVAKGTNLAAVVTPGVDVLAHPGFLTEEEAELAKKNGVFIEISGRRTHAFANGHVARVCERVGAPCVVNSDAHEPGDFLNDEGARMVAKASGLPESMVRDALEANPLKVLERAGARNLPK